jgi:hypothetical protein
MLDQIDAVHYIKAGYTPLAVEFIYEDARVHGRSPSAGASGSRTSSREALS